MVKIRTELETSIRSFIEKDNRYPIEIFSLVMTIVDETRDKGTEYEEGDIKSVLERIGKLVEGD